MAREASLDFRKVGGDFYPPGELIPEKSFNDTMESLKFCGPADATLHVYADVGFEETGNKYPSIDGDYQLHLDPDVEGFSDVASSAKINWERPEVNQIGIDWGENDTEVFSIPYDERSFSIERTYLDDEPSGTAEDEHIIEAYDAAALDLPGKVATAMVTVRNVPPDPSIERITDETGAEIGADLPFALAGFTVDLFGSFTDPGSLDTHIAAVDWGDGALTALGDVVETVSASHAYAAAWDYTISVVVEDDDGGVGTATRGLAVFDTSQALAWVVEELRPLAADRNVRRALGRLEGEAGGRAANGAIDMLAKRNLNAARVKIEQAIKHVEAADAANPGLDLGTIERLLAQCAESLAARGRHR